MFIRSSLQFLLAFLIVLPTIDAQQRSFNQTINVNNEWYILHTNDFPMSSELRVYSFSDDPVEVDGQTYFGIEYYVHDDMETIISDPDRLFRESDGKIWAIFEDSEEFLLADFNLEV